VADSEQQLPPHEAFDVRIGGRPFSFHTGITHQSCISNMPFVVSAGREDFDVRMLGGGRPFTLEFANSRPAMPSAAFFAGAQAELNGVRALLQNCAVPCALRHAMLVAACTGDMLHEAASPSMTPVIHTSRFCHQSAPR